MTFDVNKVMEACKANNCTPALLMTILMQKGVKAVNPDAAEQEMGMTELGTHFRSLIAKQKKRIHIPPDKLIHMQLYRKGEYG